MIAKTTRNANLKDKPRKGKTSKLLVTIPKNKNVTILGDKTSLKDGIYFIKVKYGKYEGYMNVKALQGIVLKTQYNSNKKYPATVIITDNSKWLKIKLPQQKQFNSFSRAHGCSLAAVTTALQLCGITKSPTEVYEYAKKHLGGYTGSKLTIYGCEAAINGMAGKKIAKWKPFTGKNNDEVKEEIKQAVYRGDFVLFEQKNPIHTNTIIGRGVDGKYVIATNGKTKKVSLSYLIKIALKGYKSRSSQRNWFKGSQHGAGYVIVKNT